MDHFTEDQLNEYLDDILEVPAQVRLSAHLSECADCRARLAALQTVFELLAALPEEKPGRDLAPSILQNLPRYRSGLGWKLALAFQAGVSLGLLLLFAPIGVRSTAGILQRLIDQITRLKVNLPAPINLHFSPPMLLLPHPPSLPAPVPQTWVTLPVTITQSNFPVWLILGIAAILLFVIGNYSLVLNGSSKSKK
jgi:hypothetical protein